MNVLSYNYTSPYAVFVHTGAALPVTFTKFGVLYCTMYI